jgi:hypothetical protein
MLAAKANHGVPIGTYCWFCGNLGEGCAHRDPSGSGHAVVERLPQGAFRFPGIRALIRWFFSSPIGYTSAEPEAARAKRGIAYFRCDQHTRWPCPRPLWFLLLVPESGEMKRATVYRHLVMLCANICPSAERMRHEDNGLGWLSSRHRAMS